MRKQIFIFFVIFSFFLTSVQSGFTQGLSKPSPEAKTTSTPENTHSIVFNELEYDFGEVEEGVEVTHIFKFKNTSKSKIKITDVKTSCGCTAALVTQDEIEPSKEGDIKVTFNTAHRKGNQAKRITVRYDDPNKTGTLMSSNYSSSIAGVKQPDKTVEYQKEPVITLTIKGTVKVEIDVIPDTIFFGQIKKNQGLTREIKILPSTQKDFKIESVTSSNELITTKIEDYLEGDKIGKKLTVDLSKNYKPGRVSEHVTIKTNNQKMPQINIQISGTILGDISVTPSSLAFISSTVGVRNVRRVSLRNSGSIPLKIEQVKLDIPELTHDIKITKEGEEMEINVTFKANEGTKPRISTKMYIITNIPDQKEIEIPIYTTLRESEYIPETTKTK